MLMNTQLQGKDYLVGNHLTVADVIAAVALVLPFQTALDGGFRKAIPNVDKWAQRIISLPEFIARMGSVKFCQKALKPQLEEKKKEEAKIV